MIYLDHNATAPLDARCSTPWCRCCGGTSATRQAPTAWVATRAPPSKRRGAPSPTRWVRARRRSCSPAAAPRATTWRSSASWPAVPARTSSSPRSSTPRCVSCARELERRGAEVTWLPVDGVGRVRAADVAAALRAGHGARFDRLGEQRDRYHPADRGDRRRVPRPRRARARRCGAGVRQDSRRRRARRPLHRLGPQAGRLRTASARCSCAAASGCGRCSSAAGRSAGCARDGERRRAGRVRRGSEGAWPAGNDRRQLCARGSGVAIADLAGCRRNSPAAGCLPNTLNVSIAGMRGESLVAALDLEGIAASVGSACAAGAGEPSHVLRAIGRDAEEARDGVRFSLGVGDDGGGDRRRDRDGARRSSSGCGAFRRAWLPPAEARITRGETSPCGRRRNASSSP